MPHNGRNPILRGFNPDPSIVRVGSDYYIGWRAMWNPMPFDPGWVALFQMHGYGPAGQPAAAGLRGPGRPVLAPVLVDHQRRRGPTAVNRRTSATQVAPA